MGFGWYIAPCALLPTSYRRRSWDRSVADGLGTKDLIGITRTPGLVELPRQARVEWHEKQKRRHVFEKGVDFI